MNYFLAFLLSGVLIAAVSTQLLLTKDPSSITLDDVLVALIENKLLISILSGVLLCAEVFILKAQARRKARDLKEARREINKLAGEKEGLEAKVEELNGEIKKTEEDHEEEIEGLNGKIAELVKAKDEEIENLNTDIKSLQDVISAKDEEIGNLRKAIEKLKKDHKTEIDKMEEAHEKAIEELKSKMEKARETEIDGLKKKNDDEIVNLKKAHEKEIKELSEAHKTEIEELKKEIEELKPKVEEEEDDDDDDEGDDGVVDERVKSHGNNSIADSKNTLKDNKQEGGKTTGLTDEEIDEAFKDKKRDADDITPSVPPPQNQSTTAETGEKENGKDNGEKPLEAASGTGSSDGETPMNQEHQEQQQPAPTSSTEVTPEESTLVQGTSPVPSAETKENEDNGSVSSDDPDDLKKE